MKSLVVILSVFICFGIISCDVEITEAQLLGKWKVIGADASNEKFKKYVNTFEGEIYVFKPEGKFIYNDDLVQTVKKNGVFGTWSLDGDKLTFKYSYYVGKRELKGGNTHKITSITKDKIVWESRFDNGETFTYYLFRRD